MSEDDQFSPGNADMMVDAGTVVDIVNHLLQLVLAFVGPQRAKQLIDEQTAEAVAAEANQLESKRFGVN